MMQCPPAARLSSAAHTADQWLRQIRVMTLKPQSRGARGLAVKLGVGFSGCLLLAPALTGCAQSSRAQSLADAQTDAREEAETFRGVLSRILVRSSDAREIEQNFARDPLVLDSSTNGRQLRLDRVVVGTGTSGSGVGTLTLGVRACIRYTGQVGQDEVAMSDVECPARADSRWGAYDATVNLYD